MAKQTKLYLPAGVNSSLTTFANADGTTAKQIFVAGANDTNLRFAQACSTDTSAVNLQLFVRRSGTNYLIGTVNIPTLSGTNGTAAAKNLLNTTDLPGLCFDAVQHPILPLKAADELWAAPVSTITATKTVTVICTGDDF